MCSGYSVRGIYVAMCEYPRAREGAKERIFDPRVTTPIPKAITIAISMSVIITSTTISTILRNEKNQGILHGVPCEGGPETEERP